MNTNGFDTLRTLVARLVGVQPLGCLAPILTPMGRRGEIIPETGPSPRDGVDHLLELWEVFGVPLFISNFGQSAIGSTARFHNRQRDWNGCTR